MFAHKMELCWLDYVLLLPSLISWKRCKNFQFFRNFLSLNIKNLQPQLLFVLHMLSLMQVGNICEACKTIALQCCSSCACTQSQGFWIALDRFRCSQEMNVCLMEETAPWKTVVGFPALIPQYQRTYTILWSSNTVLLPLLRKPSLVT